MEKTFEDYVKDFKTSKTYINYSNVVFASTSLDTKERITALAIASHYNWTKKVDCWPSNATLARETGLSVKSVVRAKASLVVKGFLASQQRYDNSCIYTPMVTESLPMDSQSLPMVTESQGYGHSDQLIENLIENKTEKLKEKEASSVAGAPSLAESSSFVLDKGDAPLVENTVTEIPLALTEEEEAMDSQSIGAKDESPVETNDSPATEGVSPVETDESQTETKKINKQTTIGEFKVHFGGTEENYNKVWEQMTAYLMVDFGLRGMDAWNTAKQLIVLLDDFTIEEGYALVKTNSNDGDDW